MALHVGLYSPWNTADPRAWSGVISPMAEALRGVFDVTVIPPVGQRDARSERIRTRLRGMTGRRSLPTHTMATARLRSAALAGQLRLHTGAPLDALVTIAASTDVLSLPRDLPLVQVTDATFPAIRGFYPLATGLGRRNEREGMRVEEAGAQATDRYLVASEWAARSLTDVVGVAPHRVTVAPFGPGTPPPASVQPREPGPNLRVLAVIADWERKRGDDIVAAVARARQFRDLTLTIVGQTPEGLPSWVNAPGVVDRARLSELYRDHDLLVDLALANAAGVVMTDALASGLPVIATRVGGVDTIVRDGDTGWLVRPNEAVDATARLLTGLDAAAVTRASASALADARTRLNWNAWAATAGEVVRAAVAERRGQPSPETERRHALMVTPILPSTGGHESAGERLVNDIAQVIAARSELTMLSGEGPANRRALERGVAFAHRLLTSPPLRSDRLPRLLGVAPALNSRAVAQVRGLVASADVVDLQWEESALLLGPLRRVNADARIVVTLHDVLSQRFARQRELQSSRLRKGVWAARQATATMLEARIVQKADDVVVLSQKDADLLPQRGRRARVHVVPPAITGPLRPVRDGTGAPLLLFVAYMARWENEDAMHWFVTEILPRVRAEAPDVRVAVAGGGLRDHVVAELETNDVEVLGFVDDLEPLYEEASAVVVPLRYGAGVKFKVVDALVRGVPVVTTTVGNEGIHPADAAVVADDPAAFAEAVTAVLADPPRAEIHARARAADVAREFGPDRFRARLQEVYR